MTQTAAAALAVAVADVAVGVVVASVAAVNRSRARCSLQRGKEAACGWCDVLSGPVSIWSGAAKLPVPGSEGCDECDSAGCGDLCNEQ